MQSVGNSCSCLSRGRDVARPVHRHKTGVRVRELVATRWTLAIITLLILTGCKKENAYVPPPAAQVGVARPLQQTVTPYFEATGSAAAFNEVDLVARVEGFVQEIDYVDGALAKRGNTLFVVEPAPYQAKLQQAQAGLAATQAQLVQAEAEFTRQSTLSQREFASQAVVDVARAKRDSIRADLSNQQASLTLAEINLGYTNVTAPFDGIITEHLVSVGELVGVTGPTKLASIVQLDPIYVTFNVSEQDVLRLQAAMIKRGITSADLGTVPLDIGLMTESGYPHHGKIDYVAPTIDTATGTRLVRGLLHNPDHALLPGMFARIRVPIAVQKGEALLVPDQALGSDQGGRYLLLVDQDNVVQQRAVQIGPLVGSLRVITSGIGPSDRVVVSGLSRAIPGEKVVPQDVPVTGTGDRP